MSVLGIHPGSSGLTVRDERRLFAVLMNRPAKE